MAWFRCALAIEVVLFHTGQGWLAGPIAVAAFYVLSGYIITRVIVENYSRERRGTLRFYVNRLLRLLPAFLVVSALTMFTALAAMHFWGMSAAQLPGHFAVQQYDGNLLTTFLRGVVPHVTFGLEPVPRLTSTFGWIPPYWSVSIELGFYLLAPLLVACALRWGYWVLPALFALSAGGYALSLVAIDGDPFLFTPGIYRNFLNSLPFFLWGATLYAASRRLTYRFPVSLATAGAVLFLVLIATPSDDLQFISILRPGVASNAVWHVLTLLALVPVVLVAPLPARFLRLDRYLGDLSYGIYINHFWVIAALQLHPARVAQLRHEPFDLAATHFGLSQPVFQLVVVAISVVSAMLIFRLVETPVQSLRRRLGSRKPTDETNH